MLEVKKAGQKDGLAGQGSSRDYVESVWPLEARSVTQEHYRDAV